MVGQVERERPPGPKRVSDVAIVDQVGVAYLRCGDRRFRRAGQRERGEAPGRGAACVEADRRREGLVERNALRAGIDLAEARLPVAKVEPCEDRQRNSEIVL